jgi:hypothetical protein
VSISWYNVPWLSLTSAVKVSTACHEEEVVRVCSLCYCYRYCYYYCYSLTLEWLKSCSFHSGFIKGKGRPITDLEGIQREQWYSSTLSLTSALDGVGVQRHAPAAYRLEENRYPLYRRLGRPQGRSGRVRRNSPPPGFDPRTVRPVAKNDFIVWLKSVEKCSFLGFVHLTYPSVNWSLQCAQFDFGREQDIFSASKCPEIHWDPTDLLLLTLPPGIKQPRRDANHSPNLIPILKGSEAIILTPTCDFVLYMG